ncbi:MAG: hypothetical protein DMD30_12485, partial [Gemmatimonadetes bacterium]
MRKVYITNQATASYRNLKFSLILALTLSSPFQMRADAQQRRLSNVMDIGAQAIGVATRESPALHGRTLSEGYLTQPTIMAQLLPLGEALSLKATLNLEGATIKRGELNAGIYGEGYIDRRHPHTYLHELVITS